MQDLLYCKNLHGPLEGEEGRQKETSGTDWKILDRKARDIIRHWLEDLVFTMCLWRSLYERKTATNKAFLIWKPVNLKYEGCSIAEHPNEVKNIIDQLTSIKVYLNDKLQTLLLFSLFLIIGKHIWCHWEFSTWKESLSEYNDKQSS